VGPVGPLAVWARAEVVSAKLDKAIVHTRRGDQRAHCRLFVNVTIRSLSVSLSEPADKFPLAVPRSHKSQSKVLRD
jgi:hypothetical protein